MGCGERVETTLRCVSLGGLLFVVVAQLQWGWSLPAVRLPPSHGGTFLVVPVLSLWEPLDTTRQVGLANGTDVTPPLWVSLIGRRTEVWVSCALCGLLVLLTLLSLVLNCARAPAVAEAVVVAVRTLLCVPAAVLALLGAGTISAELSEPGKEEPLLQAPIRMDTWFVTGLFLAASVPWNGLELGLVLCRDRRRRREEELALLEEGGASDAPAQATPEPGIKTVAGANPYYNWDSVSADSGIVQSAFPPDELTNRTPASSSDRPNTAKEMTPSHRRPHNADTEGETLTTRTQPNTLSSSATH